MLKFKIRCKIQKFKNSKNSVTNLMEENEKKITTNQPTYANIKRIGTNLI